MRIFLILCGCLAVVLGILGIFLPLLPTTPFLLLAAACFFRSSPRLYNWLISHKRMGPYIRNFREHRAIPLKAKVISVSMVWITMLTEMTLVSCRTFGFVSPYCCWRPASPGTYSPIRL